MSLSTHLRGLIKATLLGTADHGAPSVVLEAGLDLVLPSGTTANKADRVFSDQRTLAASATEDLDLSGTLTDVLGGAAVFAKVKAIMIKAAAGNTNNVVVGAAASNPFLGPLGGTAPTITIPPGGVMLLAAPAGGWAVTGGSNDVLKVANSAAGTPVTYDVIVVGTSA